MEEDESNQRGIEAIARETEESELSYSYIFSLLHAGHLPPPVVLEEL